MFKAKAKRRFTRLLVLVMLCTSLGMCVSASAGTGTGWDRATGSISIGNISADLWNYCSLGVPYNPIGCTATTTANQTTRLNLVISYGYSNGMQDGASLGWVNDYYAWISGNDAMGTAYVGSTHYVSTTSKFLFADGR